MVISFQHFLTEQNKQQVKPDEVGPNKTWDDLINDHRIHFNSKFDQKKLQLADKAFVNTFFKTYKYSKQTQAGNVFETKIGGTLFKIGYFGKQMWAASLDTQSHREVTEKFQITDMKIAPMFEIFDKAIKQQTFKDLLPVTTK